MRILPSLVLVALAAPAFAQDAVRTVEVDLASFSFTPSTIELRAGAPIVLKLVNTGRGGHNFSAPEFFAAARLAPGQAAIAEGTVEVPSRQTIEVRLTPARGQYSLRCTHTLQTAFGMRGEIVVR
ncbi:cupredoxin domain-containing protein [Sphingosinicella sp. LHD-64]|uniref:cupredoxin domain-containing protein n=1 Tax=Sphingosinicella sp. LHD-64 TaxID=3072139 RepID=UPI00280DE9D4|nr:cupredoxin domain-containing protein [Sphingosinicella sp. LHD-64]MDQ8758114.1 cupredoxin domain-containing protein [Sphingosinicella sp. LHD-64]